jgi:hypothetical protein
VAIGRGTATGVLSATGASAIAARVVKAFVCDFVGLGHFGPLTDPDLIADVIVTAVDTAGA